ncbi:cytochrome P450 27C1-like [Anneissia japonica]|uniref:cytochrome P450 27C1-like n=1 Tax=Anneissia japonica TaxID=1529436 RepID=UPI001425947C|nr:cytochrome P450 27C1-like [Anneissia japonica]
MATKQAFLLRRELRSLIYRHNSTAVSAVEGEQNVKSSVQSYDKIPGPKGWPLLGTLPFYLLNGGLGNIFMNQIAFSRKYGPIWKESMGTLRIVNLSDPVLIEEMYRNDNKYPTRIDMKPWKEYRDFKNKENALITLEGKNWHRIRRVISKLLLPPLQVHSYQDTVNDVITDMVSRLRFIRDKTNQNSRIPDITNELYKWSMETVFMLLFETRMGCLEDEIADGSQKFISSIHKMFDSGQIMFIASPKLFRRYNLKPWRDHVEAWDYIFKFAQDAMDKRIAYLNTLPEEDIAKSNGLLTRILASQKMTNEEISANMCEILLAGVDTTSNTLAWALYQLCRNPDIQDRLHNEVLSTVGLDRIACVNDIKNIPLVKNIVKETLRMYPVVSANNRIFDKDVVIGGYEIPKNTIIGSLQYVLGHDENIFPEPDRFIPDRWMRSGGTKASTFASIPFGFGTRMCIGRRVAELELHLALIRISQQFKITYLGKPDETVKPQLRGLLAPGDLLPVGLEDR